MARMKPWDYWGISKTQYLKRKNDNLCFTCASPYHLATSCTPEKAQEWECEKQAQWNRRCDREEAQKEAAKKAEKAQRKELIKAGKEDPRAKEFDVDHPEHIHLHGWFCHVEDCSVHEGW